MYALKAPRLDIPEVSDQDTLVHQLSVPLCHWLRWFPPSSCKGDEPISRVGLSARSVYRSAKSHFPIIARGLKAERKNTQLSTSRPTGVFTVNNRYLLRRYALSHFRQESERVQKGKICQTLLGVLVDVHAEYEDILATHVRERYNAPASIRRKIRGTRGG